MASTSIVQQIINKNESSSEAYVKSLLDCSFSSYNDFNYIYGQTMLLRVIDMKLKELLLSRIKYEEDDKLLFYTLVHSQYTYVVNSVTSCRRNTLFFNLPLSAKAAAFYRVFSEPILQEVIERVEMIKEIKKIEKENTM